MAQKMPDAVHEADNSACGILLSALQSYNISTYHASFFINYFLCFFCYIIDIKKSANPN
jgi:hypothetical protein